LKTMECSPWGLKICEDCSCRRGSKAAPKARAIVIITDILTADQRGYTQIQVRIKSKNNGLLSMDIRSTEMTKYAANAMCAGHRLRLLLGNESYRRCLHRETISATWERVPQSEL